MSKYTLTGGVLPAPLKVVLYGVEGIGKSSFAARFPQPVFIDTEGGTGRLDVQRLLVVSKLAFQLVHFQFGSFRASLVLFLAFDGFCHHFVLLFQTDLLR